MSVKSPSGTSNEVSVEVHPVPGEKSHKRPKRSTDKDGTEVIIDSRHDDMASAQLPPDSLNQKLCPLDLLWSNFYPQFLKLLIWGKMKSNLGQKLILIIHEIIH